MLWKTQQSKVMKGSINYFSIKKKWKNSYFNKQFGEKIYLTHSIYGYKNGYKRKPYTP